MMVSENNLPKITVITPSYNQGPFLKQTIESVLIQDYPNLQYIIIDGGSNDNSLSIIKEYGDKIDYWVSEKDQGQTDAINKGLAIATGEIVTWINSDDLLIPGALVAVAEFYKSHSKPELISAMCIRIDENNNFLFCHSVPKQSKYFAKRGLVYIDQPGTFWKTAFIKYPILDEKLIALMDHDLWYNILINNGNSYSINKITAAFRIHKRSKTSTIMPQFIVESKLLRMKYCNVKKISFSTTLLYRLWKLLACYYLKSFYLSKYPNKSVLNYLKVLSKSSNNHGIEIKYK